MIRGYRVQQVWCKWSGGASPVVVAEVDAGHQFAVGGAGSGEVVVAFGELQAQVDGLLFEVGDLLVEGVDVGRGTEAGLAPGVLAEGFGEAFLQLLDTRVEPDRAFVGGEQVGLQWRPHDFRRIFVTDAIRSGLPPHIAAKLCGHSTVDTTMGYAAIYPEDVIAHHRAFIARRRAERPSEEYRDLTAREWDEFLAHFELRKVALGTCGRDHGTPCAHENACVRCPLLRVDPAQMPRLEEIHTNLVDRLQEAKEQGWLGEVAAIETTLAAAVQKLEAMRALDNAVHLGMPDIRVSTGRSSPG